MEDLEIIELYNSRDEAAIEATRAKYGNYAGRIAFNVLGNVQDAEECVSDVYMKLWNAIPPAKPANFKAFLGKIMRNLALDRFEALRAEKRGGGQYDLCLEELAECLAAEGEPDYDLTASELSQSISNFLAGQEPKNAKIFVRRYWYMDSIKDVAVSCGCTDAKVKTTLCRMRRELKEWLSEEGIEI